MPQSHAVSRRRCVGRWGDALRRDENSLSRGFFSENRPADGCWGGEQEACEWEVWGGKRLCSPPRSRALSALKFSRCDFRLISSNVPGRGSQWGPLIPVLGLSCRCLEPFPRQASALRGFLTPVPPSSSSPFLPLMLRAAPSVLAFRWLQTMSLFTRRLGFGGKGKAQAQRRKEGGREASAPVLGQPSSCG